VKSGTVSFSKDEILGHMLLLHARDYLAGTMPLKTRADYKNFEDATGLILEALKERT
jgi:hypothetical protein